MNKEYNLIQENLTDTVLERRCVRGLLNGKDIILTCSGIGKVNAAQSLTEVLCDYDVKRVVSIGCAGAITTKLKVGDIVIGNSYCYHDVYCGAPNENGQVQDMPAVFPSDFNWIKGIEKYYLGTIATGDWFVNTREKAETIKSYLPTYYNVCAVDMESAALAQVCYKEKVKFTSIRIISDNPLLPNQDKQYKGFWDNMAENVFNVLIKAF